MALSRAVASVDGDQILVAGGLLTSGATSAAVMAFDPAAGTVTSVGKLKHAVQSAGGGTLGGQMLVYGGDKVAAVLWIQSVAADGSVTNAGALPRARSDLSVASVGSQLIVVGGGNGKTLDSQVLGTADGVHFSVVAQLLQGVRSAAVAALNGNVYVIGGEVGTGDTATVQIVDVASGKVTLGTPLTATLSHATALVVGGAILVLGGRHNGVASTLIQRIDPVDGSIKTVGQLPHAVADAAGAVLDGKGYLIGGEVKKPTDTIVVVSPGS